MALTYTKLKDIENAFEDFKCNKILVHDSSKNLMRLWTFDESEKVSVWQQVVAFMNNLEGDYCIITFKAGQASRGGDTTATQLRFYYKLSVTGSMYGNQLPMGYGNQFERIQQLEMKLLEMKYEKKIEELESKVNKSSGGSMFENVAEIIGKTFFEGYMKKEGFELQGEKWVRTGVGGVEAAAPAAPVNKNVQSAAVGSAGSNMSAEDRQAVAKRGANAIKTLVNVGGLEIIDGMEKMAKMATENPIRLMQILQPLMDENGA